ncbi:MAG: penicillin acylase family protein [Rhodobacteraceae bacterium]|nr:penicillin acylase family protein [Paracoccaceae bacterium]
MRMIFKALVRLLAGVMILMVLGVGVVYYLAQQSLPDYDNQLAVDGISAPVEIVRSNANVPHIFGTTDTDVFFGLGYAHAQDRLWQMTVMRRVAQGKMSEVFGARTVEIDALSRRLDLYRLSQRAFEVQDERTQAIMRAYAAGVNARLFEINEFALGRGAPEMFLFSAPVAPWTPADSMAIQKVLGLLLSGHVNDEVLYARTSLMLDDAARVSEIMPDYPGDGIAALEDYAAVFPGLPKYAKAIEASDPLIELPKRGLAGASNIWAAAPHRSAAGGTLLASDPHLGFSAPGKWYLARLELQSGGVIGGTIPGVPAVFMGRSDRLAWGFTSAYVDDQDVVIEKLNPENPEEYQTPTGWKRFRSRPSILEIKDAEPITLTLRWSQNGPVLSGSDFDLGTITPPGHVAALNWTLLTPEDRSASALIGLMYADDIDEALEGMSDFVAPAQNLGLIDREGIALKTVGVLPKRDPRHQSQGRYPAPGWRAENLWQGALPFADNPAFIQPEGGIVGNTNNKTVDRPFPNHVSFIWGDSQRVNRWTRLMENRRVHTRDSFIEAQLDTVSHTARSLLPLIGSELWFTGESAPDGTRERQRQIALELLASWNGEMNEHMPEPLIYAAWMRALQKRIIADELGPLADEFKHIEPLFLEKVFRGLEGADIWCDVRQSTREETCEDMARLALDDALIWIEDRYGDQLESLRWGDAHQATHDHDILGGVPVLRHFVNIRQSTSGGDNTLQRGRTSGEDPEPFQNVHGAGYRGVYDFADPDSSVFITSTGQSGHFLSRHYDDLSQLWRRGEYLPMSLDPDLARAASVGVTVLEPR